MAEFGELLPGTKWRAVGGNKVEILSHHLIPTRVTRPDGTSYEATMRGNDPEAVAKWVRWVEPIAVGDRVIVDYWADHDVHHKACATFTDDGEDWVTIRLGFSSGPNFKTLRASKCRKVNDE